jgi:uncharacterized protein YdhG (YjbR/CyaY superfamily)
VVWVTSTCQAVDMASSPATVEEYQAAQPEEVQQVLREVRRHLAAAVPEAVERISYGMPTLALDGSPLISYGAWKSHLGLYPVPQSAGPLEEAVAPYRSTKDTLRFRYRDPIPYELIGRIAAARAATLRP